MNDIRQMLIDSSTKIMKDYCEKEVILQAEQGVFPSKLWDVLKESGMITVGVPEESGGSGGNFGDAFSILRVAGKFSAPIPLAETYMANWLLAEFGLPISEEPLTLAEANPNASAIRFEKTEGGWKVRGVIEQLPWGRSAQAAVVSGSAEQGLIIAKINVEDCELELDSNIAGEPRDRLILKEVYVPEAHTALIDEKDLEKMLFLGALTRSVLMAGALERTLELSAAYSGERLQFGRPLNRFQAIQHHLAVLAGESAAASVAANYAVEAYEHDPFSSEIIVAKIRTGEAASVSAPIAHQVHGAIGFTDEHTLHLSTRRLWSWRDEYGSEAVWAKRLGEQVLNAGHGVLWEQMTSTGKGPMHNE